MTLGPKKYITKLEMKLFYAVIFILIQAMPVLAEVNSTNYLNSDLPSETSNFLLTILLFVGCLFCLLLTYLFFKIRIERRVISRVEKIISSEIAHVCSGEVLTGNSALIKAINKLEDFLGDAFIEADLQKAEVISQNRDLELSRKILEDRNADLVLADTYKTQFLANMSHEIRTPLNSIINFSELALEADSDQSWEEYIKIINFSSRHLLSLVNDILDITKIEAGKMELDSVVFSLQHLIQELIHILKPQLLQHSHDFIYEIDESMPVYLVGDPLRFKQIIINLISNASKFTPSGGSIILSLGVERIKNQALTIIGTVTDTGIGIADNNKAKVFENFSQADASTTRKYGGSGLGLSIASKLVQLAGGNLTLESKLGVGTQFLFTMKFKLPNEEMINISKNEQKICEASLDRLQILVAEDNPVNQKLLGIILKKHGHLVEYAENGNIAIEKYQSKKFDLVLMDIQMEQLDGLQATKVIRDYESTRGIHVPIIALTANAVKGDRDKCIQAGMDGYVSKPIDRKQLLNEIARCVLQGGLEVTDLTS